jgi:hypothetical protein
MSLFLILIVIALILALMAAVNVPSRIGLFPLAFAVFLLAIILQGYPIR